MDRASEQPTGRREEKKEKVDVDVDTEDRDGQERIRLKIISVALGFYRESAAVRARSSQSDAPTPVPVLSHESKPLFASRFASLTDDTIECLNAREDKRYCVVDIFTLCP